MAKLKPLLDDPERRLLVLASLAKHGTILSAAAEAGVSRRALGKYRAANPDFDERCRLALGGELEIPTDVAEERVRRDADAAVRMAVSSYGTVEVEQEDDIPSRISGLDVAGPSVDELMERLWEIAKDNNHRGLSTALGILARVKLWPLAAEAQRVAERNYQLEQQKQLSIRDVDAVDAEIVEPTHRSGLVILEIPAIEEPEEPEEASGFEPEQRDAEVLDG